MRRSYDPHTEHVPLTVWPTHAVTWAPHSVHAQRTSRNSGAAAGAGGAADGGADTPRGVNEAFTGPFIGTSASNRTRTAGKLDICAAKGAAALFCTRPRGSHRSGTVSSMAHDAAVAAVFEPVAPPTTFEETVERLGSAIRLGILGPGTRLPSERELADQLGISRSTLRQAITTLVQSGHITSVRGRGGGTFVVQEPPLAEGSPAGAVRPDWRLVLDLRVAIEIGAATLAAERAGDDDLALMRGCVERMNAATEFDDYRRADVGFHMAIAQASGVPRLVALMTEVHSDVAELIAHIAHPPEVLAHSNLEHAKIVDAWARGEGARGITLLRRHLEGTEHILGGLFPAGAPA
ncbi:MAG: hypothetical protein QOI62_205 [Solirubrobacteraceae bacterium]|nr:hypothetical protein [Solirubrobacteraceae bacterium]